VLHQMRADPVPTSKWVASLKGHVAAITAVEWTTGDTPVLMSASIDHTLRLWRFGPLTDAVDAAAARARGAWFVLVIMLPGLCLFCFAG
jgi:hypothetical protein